MNRELGKAILATLVYFDIFDYPLTLLELWKYLYTNIGLERSRGFSLFNKEPKGSTPSVYDIQETLESSDELKKVISQKNGFYFSKGREDLVRKRQEYYNMAQPKWKIARKAAKYLQLVPFIKMVAVCNTLAYNNAREESDIDFFIVVKSGRMWTARFLATLLMQFLGLRRYSKKIKDRVCLSFYVTEDDLNLSDVAIEDDIYLRYWISQIVPLYVRDEMDVKFVKTNQWVKDYLPNFTAYQAGQKRRVLENKFFVTLRNFREKMLKGRSGDAVEHWLRKIQKNKMAKNAQSLAKKPGTEVIISDTILKFHEVDRRREFREKFEDKFTRMLHELH